MVPWLSCSDCQEGQDGADCGPKYEAMRSDGLKDCWRPRGHILVWDERDVE